jgi:sulfoacetaldehyde dehydrogenase
MAAVADYDQATVDRLCRAVAWATANEQTFGRLTRMSVEESGMGSAEGGARAPLEDPGHPSRCAAHAERRIIGSFPRRGS